MAFIRVRRKRNAEPQNALLVTGALNQQEDDETAAGPSKRARQQNEQNLSAFRLIGTLPMSDVRDAARLFLPNESPQTVEYVEIDNLANGGSHVPVSVQMNNVQDLLMENMAKVNSMNLSEKPIDPFLASVDEAPLARPESGLDGELDDFVYDFYHAGTSFASQAFERVNVRLPTDEELQLYFGPDKSDEEESDDGTSDSNAENYFGNDYPDNEDFEGALENDTTSDDSYDYCADEKTDYHDYLSSEDY